MNLARLFTDTVASDPDRRALLLDDTVFTYGEIDEASARVATLLTDRGIASGDAVGVMLPNTPQFVIAYYGVLRAGGVVVPMNPLLKSREVAYYLGDSGARMLFAAEAFGPEAQAGAEQSGAEVVIVGEPAGFVSSLRDQEPRPEVADREDDDTAVLLYTSGTTGQPKGAELTHANLASNVRVTQDDLLQLTADDVVFGGLPMFHVFGQTCALNTAMAAGATLLLLPRFDAGVAAELLATHRATVFAGVPTMYAALLGLDDAPALPDLRVCVSGGASMPVEVLRRFEERFDAPVLEGYGLSETSPVASFNLPDRERRVGSIGVPVSGVEMRVLDPQGQEVATGEVGEIAVRGANVMKGYWNRPEQTAEVLSDDGWFRTGDLGKRDEDGYFYIVDRKKDLVIRGGYNVYPREIEEVLYEHPDVAAAAVVGVPHPSLGEEVGAAVVLKTGASTTADELRDFVKQRVAAYKYPRLVWVEDDLPKGPTGKIQKRDIEVPAELTEDLR
ncbi:long-chain acyl-CoA synthetase [Barrientosiimonas humi]|uniref:Long-chain acyl-CoA synthetase n=1 Tax=Barrientosiimonas humi TaxID=999931 RepID=A0A542XCF4_9MICO|nr:long-chain fatty acid--CoA ligase [Barrientosiimonas humi]TQL33521.1 long-chain acyl-CoA synthetase [Barrientosiimonas humi]CAG7573509.1 Long-chain-fatty-acid--CoA ligase [Barrientosiimonas humi]